MKPILLFFAVVAAVGLVLSAMEHAAALIGMQGPLGNYAPILHVGIFVVWLPAVLASNRLVKNYPRKDFWKAALRGCPNWMKYMTWGFFGYAMLNFAVFILNAPKQSGAGPMPPQVVRGFSGHWMAFYSAAMAILYSAAQLWNAGWEWHCPEGHEVQPLAQFCDQCGQPVGRLGQPQNKP